jgi:hypothetical protein
MKSPLRILAGPLGLFLIVGSSFELLLFVAMETQEIHSSTGPISIWGGIGGSALVLGVAGFFSLLGYWVLQFSFTGPHPTTVRKTKREAA